MDSVTSSSEGSPRTARASCRICRLNHGPLCHPCKCSGSIRYVHEDCLVQWLEVKYGRSDDSNMRCEVCGEVFRFRKVYAENAPSHLSMSQFVRGLSSLFFNCVSKGLRFVAVLFMWFLLVPCITGFLWNLYFDVNRRKYDVFAMFGWSNVMPWLVDSVLGTLVCAGIALCCVLIAAYKEFISNNPDLLPYEEDHTPNNVQEPVMDAANPMYQDDDPQADANAQPNPNAAEPQLDQREPQPQMLQDENNNDDNEATLEQILGFEGPIRNIFENFVIVFIFIIASLNLFVFIPYTAGYHIEKVVIGLGSRQTRAMSLDDERSFLSHCFVLAKGYSLQAAAFLLWSLTATLFQHFYNRRDGQPTYHIRNAIYYTKLVYYFIKVVTMVTINFFITPVILGYLLNASTASFFDTSLKTRIETYSNAPISLTIFHFFLGMTILLNFGTVVRKLRTIIRNDVLWFLSNPDDPEFHYFRNVVQNSPMVHLRRFIMTLILFSIIILATIRTPLKILKNLYPDFFPLILPHGDWSSDFLFHFDTFLVFVLPQLTLSSFWSKISEHLKGWIETVATPLGLIDYFFEPEENNKDVDSDDDEQVIYSIRVENPSNIKFFAVRITVFLVVAWCTTIVLVSLLLPLPIITGRFLLSKVGKFEPSDFTSWLLGYHLLIAIKLSVGYVYQQMTTLQMRVALRAILKYSVIGVKVWVLCFLWFVVQATLLGACFYILFVFPFVPLSMHPKPPNDHLLSVGWMVGSILYQLSAMSKEGSFLYKYGRELQRIRRDGWRNVNMSRILRNLILPWTIGMMLFTHIPVVVSRYFVPLVLYRGLGLPIAEVVMKQQLVRRYTNILAFTALTSVHAVRKFAYISHQLYEKIFDQQYVIRRSLENVVDNPEVEEDAQSK